MLPFFVWKHCSNDFSLMERIHHDDLSYIQPQADCLFLCFFFCWVLLWNVAAELSWHDFVRIMSIRSNFCTLRLHVHGNSPSLLRQWFHLWWPILVRWASQRVRQSRLAQPLDTQDISISTFSRFVICPLRVVVHCMIIDIWRGESSNAF